MATPNNGKFCTTLTTILPALPAPSTSVRELRSDVKVPGRTMHPVSKSHVKKLARMFWISGILSSYRSIFMYWVEEGDNGSMSRLCFAQYFRKNLVVLSVCV